MLLAEQVHNWITKKPSVTKCWIYFTLQQNGTTIKNIIETSFAVDGKQSGHLFYQNLAKIY